jgi:DNA modification methylase
MRKKTVSEQRNYFVLKVTDAKAIAYSWLEQVNLNNVISFGLPEVDDRYHIWRVPLKSKSSKENIGEVVIDAFSAEVLIDKTTRPELLESRLLKKIETAPKKKKKVYELSQLRNTIGYGDSEELLDEMPSESVNLIFTSPPYFNARPEYTEYEEYEHYLLKMRCIIRKSHRVLSEGRYFIMNTSPILIRRANRNEASRRIAVTFDLHKIFIEEGYEFVDDIIWVKPEGAGWATGRGRRFAADRNPLQYKAVPVTEYLIVYRKKSDLLIDWLIRNHPDQRLVKESKIKDGYEKTNIWKITPNTHSKHPAPFPLELAEKVITYYSFKEDVVLDPFAGSGTVGAAAIKHGRRFVLYDNNSDYIQMMINDAQRWLDSKFKDVLLLNCDNFPKTDQMNMDL